MRCPYCGDEETKVVDSRLVAEGNQIRRRRECLECAERFTTYETSELLMPKVIKGNGNREPFNEEKLRYGMLKALEKRPVPVEIIEAEVNKIKQHLITLGEREIESIVVGEEVMQALHRMDEIAYVRFASVYRNFKDLAEFQQEINRMKKIPAIAQTKKQRKKK